MALVLGALLALTAIVTVVSLSGGTEPEAGPATTDTTAPPEEPTTSTSTTSTTTPETTTTTLLLVEAAPEDLRLLETCLRDEGVRARVNASAAGYVELMTTAEPSTWLDLVATSPCLTAFLADHPGMQIGFVTRDGGSATTITIPESTDTTAPPPDPTTDTTAP